MELLHQVIILHAGKRNGRLGCISEQRYVCLPQHNTAATAAISEYCSLQYQYPISVQYLLSKVLVNHPVYILVPGAMTMLMACMVSYGLLSSEGCIQQHVIGIAGATFTDLGAANHGNCSETDFQESYRIHVGSTVAMMQVSQHSHLKLLINPQPTFLPQG